MPRKKKTIHYLYKTTCIITNKYYVGIHSTIKLEDGYLGSGKRLRYSLRKHGPENHVKEILEFFNTREELVLKEKEIVNIDLLKDKLCLNLQPGGGGGFVNKEHAKKAQNAANKAFVLKCKNNPEFKAIIVERLNNNRKKAIESKNNLGKRPLGIKHTEESKKKIGQANKKYSGELSFHWGTCWITKDLLNKKIKKSELDKWTLDGWSKGRYCPRKKIIN